MAEQDYIFVYDGVQSASHLEKLMEAAKIFAEVSYPSERPYEEKRLIEKTEARFASINIQNTKETYSVRIKNPGFVIYILIERDKESRVTYFPNSLGDLEFIIQKKHFIFGFTDKR